MASSSRRKGAKAAPYDSSTQSSLTSGIETLVSLWQNTPLPMLPDLLTTDKKESGAKKGWSWKGKGKAKNGTSAADDPVQMIFATSQAMLKWYASLAPQTQRYVAWSFLGFLVLFVSGFWKLKMTIAVFLLLLKPFSPSKHKAPKKQKDANGNLFSADGRVAAFQRIPDLTTYGNVAPAKHLGSDALPEVQPPKSFIKERASRSSTPVAHAGPVQEHVSRTGTPVARSSPVKEPAVCSSTPPSRESLPPSRSSTPVNHKPTIVPHTTRPSMSSAPPHLPATIISAHSRSDSAVPTVADSPSEPAGMGSSWERKPSGSFHRIEVAKKFVNRKLGKGQIDRSVSMPAGCAIADDDDDANGMTEVLRDISPTGRGWAAAAR